MSNTNSKNLENCNSCNSCNYCNSCYYCNYCNSCDSCYYCNYCNSCNYCDSCDSCYYCNYCNSCNYCDSCDFSSGLRMSEYMIFCLGEGRGVSQGLGYQKNYHIFNKPVSKEQYQKVKDDLIIKNFKLPIAKWVETKDMTKEEKDNWSSHKQTGGFLKTLPYKGAWKEMWAGLSQEDKSFFRGIVGFDADIFEGITGIKVEDEISLVGKEVKVELDGRVYKAIIQS